MNPKKVSRLNHAFHLNILLLTFAIFAGSLYGQNTQKTTGKADQDLKSNARINPSTLAMEFSLPVAAYPGRNGNSVPITLDYSSKVWSMERTNYRSEAQQVSGNEYYNTLVYQSTDVTALFSFGRSAGWSANMGPVLILSPEVFNQWGSSFFAGPFNSGENTMEEGCVLHSSTTRPNTACQFGFEFHNFWICPLPDGTGGRFVEETMCLDSIPTGGGNGGIVPPIGSGGEPQVAYVSDSLRVQFQDGSKKEFRRSDRIFGPDNLQPAIPTEPSTYFSVDGSRMRLEMNEAQGNQQFRNVLYLPDGSRYEFPIITASNNGILAERLIDSDGNVTRFSESTWRWIDSLGRELVDPLPLNGGNTTGNQTIIRKGINNSNVSYQIGWETLANLLEFPQDTQLKYSGEDNCQTPITNATPITPSLFQNQPTDVLDDQIENTTRYIRKHRACASIALFNPVVVSGIMLPNGERYRFRYNEYAEITRIDYPTGGYERFEYGYVDPIGYTALEIYKQSNRGVLRHFVSSDGVTEFEAWTYSGSGSGTVITRPDGTKSERDLFHSETSSFGTEDPRNGLIKEERVKDANGLLRSRTLTDWQIKNPSGTGMLVPNGRDPRPARTISISYEGGLILATMSETVFDEPGPGSNAPTDAGYFAHLNPKQTKSYHFITLTPAEANAPYQDAIVNLANKFHTAGQLAAISETDYLYDARYKRAGIPSLPTESRSLNPLSPTEAIVKTQTIYDEPGFALSGSLTGSQTATWIDPATQPHQQDCLSQLEKQCRGKPTSIRLWDSDRGTWITARSQYDQYGNARKVWEADEPTTSDRFVETEYSADYHFAYPTRVITPAPDPSGTNGMNQKSEAVSLYDMTTGLVLSTTALNDLTTSSDDLTTATEYDDLLRPIRSYPVNFSAPEAVTEFGVPDSTGQLPAGQRFVRIRKQIDPTSWDVATTWFDGLGRAVKTQATDSQGDIFVETEYDLFGRVRRTSNPYRNGDQIFWSRPRYDELSRVVETCAPSLNPGSGNDPCPTGTSTGTTAFSFSTVQNAVGTVVTSTDASGRRSRSITNALGQLIRVDEPTAIGGTNDLGDIATPNQPTYYTYNVQGKMVRVQQGKPGEPTPIQYRYFKYDSLGRLIRVMQPEQEPNANLALSDSYNTSGQWSAAFQYNALGDLVRATDANGVSIINEYDKAKRVTRRCYSKPNLNITATTCNGLGANASENTPEVTFLYDGLLELSQSPSSPNLAKGKLTRVSSSVSDTRYTQFDSLGRLTQMQQITDGVTYTSQYQYNFAGALVQETYPSGRVVRNEFESDGDLSRIWGKKDVNAPERTYANSFSYTASGGIERLKLGNNRWETAKFNERAQLTQIGIGVGVTDDSVWKLEYKYGELESGSVNLNKNTGNIAQMVMTVGGMANPIVQNYSYDPLYRLTEGQEMQGSAQNWIQQFQYDRFGNRTALNQTIQKTAGAVQTNTTPAIDPATNRFITTNQNFRYDKNGNLTTDSDNRTVVFDGENKQAEIKNASGQTIGQYFYDGEGKRVKKVTWNTQGVSETTIFVYSAGKLVAEYSNTQVPVTNPTTRYLTEDHLGTPRVVTDSQGTVISRRDFLPFGEQLDPDVGGRSSVAAYQPTNDNVKQKFTGYQKDDESGLDFAEARMYENRHGRFTTVDPLLASGESANPQTFNRYSYTMNSPLYLVDPSGLAPDDWYIQKDGELEVFRTDERSDRFYGWDTNKEGYVLIATLDKKEVTLPTGEMIFLVQFPQSGYGFGSYNSMVNGNNVEPGGYDPVKKETAGAGDHWLRPIVAAALFGLMGQAKADLNTVIDLGDMSSANGSDPWNPDDLFGRNNGHHGGHGHLGDRSGLDIDWRYVDKNGISQKASFADSQNPLDKVKNQKIFDLAKKWGFTNNYRGPNSPITGVAVAGGHDNHGHFGFGNLSVKELKYDRNGLPKTHFPRISRKDRIIGL